MSEEEIKQIGGISNYYGWLHVKKKNGHCYWAIQNYDGHGWEEIPLHLYEALVGFETERPESDEYDHYDAIPG